MASLESSLLDMHVAQEQYYVGGIFAMEEVLQKALWCFSVIKKYDQPHMTCRYCSSIFLGAIIFLIVQHVVNEASYVLFSLHDYLHCGASK